MVEQYGDQGYGWAYDIPVITEEHKEGFKKLVESISTITATDMAVLSIIKEEAAAYFNLGVNKLRELTGDDHCPFVLWNGSKRLIKRKALEEFLNTQYSI